MDLPRPTPPEGQGKARHYHVQLRHSGALLIHRAVANVIQITVHKAFLWNRSTLFEGVTKLLDRPFCGKVLEHFDGLARGYANPVVGVQTGFFQSICVAAFRAPVHHLQRLGHAIHVRQDDR